MGNLLLVRHASTDASQEGRNLGQGSDPPLSDHGRRLADELGTALAAELTELPAAELRLITSPALRCRQTAAGIVQGLGVTPETEVEPGLLEINYGAWEGLTAAECAERDPERRAAWDSDPFATPAPGGESGADVATRAFPILESIEAWLTDRRSRCAIVVAHNHVNRLRLAALMGWPMADYRRRLAQDPACYSLIAFSAHLPLMRRVNAAPVWS
jgi:broad specificity phosphatase PhoE